MKTASVDSIRTCTACGTFYPADPAELAGTIDLLLKDVPRDGTGSIRGIIAPHAGYIYSGPTAALAYGRIAGSVYESVVVVSPSHRELFEGVSVYDGDGYATPLGVVRVDRLLRESLLRVCPFVHSSTAGHGAEHAVEVHLPFLQRALGDFPFLPLVIGHQTPEVCFVLGEALAGILRGRSVLLVASTDLSHFYTAEVAHRLDAVVIDDLGKFDERALMDHLEGGVAEACGGGPTVAVMTALKLLGSSRIDVVRYATSGDITGDQRSVVGYVGAVAQ
jgi:hypothetical protein